MNTQHTPGPWVTFEEPRQGQGTTAFEQFVEGNNGQQFDVKILDAQAGLIATIPAAHKSGYGKVLALSNARLIAEAGTVTSECGLTPRQLLDQRNELLEAAKEALAILNLISMRHADYMGREYDEVQKPRGMLCMAISKIEGHVIGGSIQQCDLARQQLNQMEAVCKPTK